MTRRLTPGKRQQLRLSSLLRKHHCLFRSPTAFHAHCTKGEPWTPSFHVSSYVRVWRSLGTTMQSINRHSYSVPTPFAPNQAQASGLCSSDMSLPTSTAAACDVFTDPATKISGFVDPTTGQ